MALFSGTTAWLPSAHDLTLEIILDAVAYVATTYSAMLNSLYCFILEKQARIPSLTVLTVITQRLNNKTLV